MAKDETKAAVAKKTSQKNQFDHKKTNQISTTIGEKLIAPIFFLLSILISYLISKLP